MKKAFFISPEGKIYPVEINHINFISSNLELFDLSDEEFKAWEIKYEDKPGYENKAKNEIIEKIIEDGWIKIREQRQHWTIELRELNEKNLRLIEKWKEIRKPDLPLKVNELKKENF